MQYPLKNSDPKQEGTLFVSKWLHLPVLISLEEMKDLLALVENIFPMGRVVSIEDASKGKTAFLQNYARSLEELLAGKKITTPLTFAITTNLDDLYSVPMKDEKVIIKHRKPVIQITKHQFALSADHTEILQKVCGNTAIAWGVQISFPQIYQDPATKEVFNAKGENWDLFRSMQKWVRSHTIATPFLIDGKKKMATLRLGKQSLSWINQHPGLILKGIKVVV